LTYDGRGTFPLRLSDRLQRSECTRVRGRGNQDPMLFWMFAQEIEHQAKALSTEPFCIEKSISLITQFWIFERMPAKAPVMQP
jgi:hypothetical protein